MANGIINTVSRATEAGSGLGDGGAVDGRGKIAYHSLNKCYLSIN